MGHCVWYMYFPGYHAAQSAHVPLQTSLPVAVNSDVHLTWENPDEADKYYFLELVVGLMGVDLLWQWAK